MSFLETKPQLQKKQLSWKTIEPIIANSTDAVLAVDPSGQILALNKEAERLCKIASRGTVGYFSEVDSCLNKASLDAMNDLVLHAVNKPNELLDKEVVITFDDGKKVHFNIHTSVLANIDGQAYPKLILVLSDVISKVKAARERVELAMFLAAIIIALLISKSVDSWALINAASVDVYSNTFVWAYTVAVSAPMLMYLLLIKKPLSEFGITLNNWKQSSIEGCAISGSLLLMVTLALFIIATSEGKALTDYIKTDWLKIETLAYIPHSVIQEFIFRGVVLTTLIRIFHGNPLWQPVLLSNLLFAFMHMHLGLGAVAITFCSGYFFSWMFLRHKTILGVSIAHLLLGSSAFIFSIL